MAAGQTDQGGSPPESLGFKVKLEAPEFPDYEGEVTDYFLTAAWATLAGVVEADGSARYRIKIRETGEDLTHVATAIVKTPYKTIRNGPTLSNVVLCLSDLLLTSTLLWEQCFNISPSVSLSASLQRAW